MMDCIGFLGSNEISCFSHYNIIKICGPTSYLICTIGLIDFLSDSAVAADL